MQRERDPADQRHAVAKANTEGRSRVRKSSTTIKAHYQQMETVLGKQKLAGLQVLRNALIAMERT